MAKQKTVTITKTLSGGFGPISTKSTITCDTEINGQPVIPAGASNYEYDIDFKRANLQGLIIVPDVGDVVMKTNSINSPGDTLNLGQSEGVFWSPGTVHANPFTADVTKLFFTNTGTKDVTVKIGVELNEGA